MEEWEVLKTILLALDVPALFIADGAVQFGNPAAEKLSLTEGTAAEELLPDYDLHEKSKAFSASTLRQGKPYFVTCKPLYGGLLCQLTPARDSAMIAADYLDVVASEIRKPLDEMYLALQKPNCDKAALQTGALTRTMMRLMRLAAQLNAGSSVAGGEMILRPDFTELSHWLNQLAELAEGLFAYTKVQFSYRGLQEPFAGCVDTEKLERAIWNLLSNALHHSSDGSTVSLLARRSGDRLLISVNDTGEGIREEIRSDVFQSAAARTGFENPRDGLGIGLSFVRAVAQLHGGSILLSDRVGGGTSAALCIPVDLQKTEPNSPMTLFDYAGGINHGLLELSDALAITAFES